jgi:hypothetical protein
MIVTYIWLCAGALYYMLRNDRANIVRGSKMSCQINSTVHKCTMTTYLLFCHCDLPMVVRYRHAQVRRVIDVPITNADTDAAVFT